MAVPPNLANVRLRYDVAVNLPNDKRGEADGSDHDALFARVEQAWNF